VDAFFRRTLALVWLVIVLPLGAMLWYSRSARGPLDDPDQAYQRPGFLKSARDAPMAAQFTLFVPSAPPLPMAGLKTLVVFVRAGAPSTQAIMAGGDGGKPGGNMAFPVVVSSAPLAERLRIPAVVDDGRLAAAYGLRRPLDGGFAVGYAIVDSALRVRYATLDPAMADHWDELATMLRATP